MSSQITKQFAESIMEKLRIKSDPFAFGLVESSVSCVRPEHYKKYYESLFDGFSDYTVPLDRVVAATKHYKQEHSLNNYALSNELAEKIVSYLLSVNNIPHPDKLTLPQKIVQLDHSNHFTPVEFKAIEFAGGLGSFLHDGKISIDTNLLLSCYNSAFFGEEPKARIELRN